MGYLIPKLSFLKNSSCTIETIYVGDKGVNTFPKGINLKVNAKT